MRERRPGVWGVRVVVGNDPATGVSKQRSFTVHGDEDIVSDRRRELVAQFGVDRSALYCHAAGWSVAELLERFLAAEHSWSPATRSSHTSMARWLAAEPIGAVGVAVLTPPLADARIGAWEQERRWRWCGPDGRCCTRVWATRQRLLRSNPLATMKAPPRPLPRKHLRMDEIAVLLRAADADVVTARKRRRRRTCGRDSRQRALDIPPHEAIPEAHRHDATVGLRHGFRGRIVHCA